MSQVLVLHPGEMGSSLAACLASQSIDVAWVSRGRSTATLERANRLDIKPYEDLESALDESSIVVSICPPEYAMQVAQSVKRIGFDGIYVDANATSPMTVAAISALIGDDFVDGSVIGPPARQANTTRLYLSGQQAESVRSLFDGSFCTAINLGESTTAASALKMCYAAYTKGTSALLINICSLAESQGIFEALKTEWQISQPDLEARSQRTGPSVSRKAWRFAGEMQEIAATFADNDLPSGFHEGAADLYSRLTRFKDLPPTSTADLVNHLITRR